MPGESRPMLFAPPQPPIPLDENTTLVVGRSRQCDLRLPDVDTSRRHAKILCNDGACTVQDLGSTNGTFVNGARIERRELRPGDRVQIGANQMLFCELSGSEWIVDDGEANTQLVARSEVHGAFQGDLSQIPTFAVLQILEMGRKSGVLRIDGTDRPGQIWLDTGEPIHAEIKGQLGFDAALALVSVVFGSFCFEPAERLPAATIEASVTELLLEASRLLDEAETEQDGDASA